MKQLAKTINVTLKIWRQQGSEAKGHFETIATENISVHMSFIEMLDTVNEQLTLDGKDPIAFDNDCREGICGTCGAVVDGQAHGLTPFSRPLEKVLGYFGQRRSVALTRWCWRASRLNMRRRRRGAPETRAPRSGPGPRRDPRFCHEAAGRRGFLEEGG